jgi:transcription antitermination factor NusG
MALRKASRMATHLTTPRGPTGYPEMPESFFEPRWYAVYTNTNHEKQVALQLGQRSIEHHLPLYDSMRRWKDRRVRLQMPLFPGYLFVRIALCDRLQVLQIPSVVHLVSFAGRPAPLKEEDVHALQNCLRHSHPVEPHAYLQVGRRARVQRGFLQGLEGIILRRKNKTRLIVSFDLIQRSVSVEIDAMDLAPAG